MTGLVLGLIRSGFWQHLVNFGIYSEIESFIGLFAHWWDLFSFIKLWDIVMVVGRMCLIAVEVRRFVRFDGTSPFG